MRIVITAGGTREYIDPIRYISNASTGRMGYALARAAVQAGHEVTLISAPVTLRAPGEVKLVNVATSGEMFVAVKEHFEKCDCLIMAAAVSDYAPVRRSKTKVKKDKCNLTIKLKPTTDILKWAGAHKGQRLIIGFALEDKALRKRAEKKLIVKNLDMIIANTPAAIGAEEVSVQIKTPVSDWLELPSARKSALAKKIIRLLADL